MRLRWLALFLVMPVVTGLVWGFVVEPRRLMVRTLAVEAPGLPPIRVGLLSDLHAGSPIIDEAKVRRCVAELNAGRPDVILLLGDYLNNRRFDGGARVAAHLRIERVADWLRDLHAPLGVYAVLGNHDWWYDGPRIRAALEHAGIRVLDDESTVVQTGAGALALAGIADRMTRRPNPAGVVAAIDEPLPVLAFTHNPDIFPDVPRRVALTVAGHTHGGQVRLPLVGAPIVPSRFGRRYARGLIEESGHRLFVTTGVGTSMIAVRFGVPPEVVFLSINGGESLRLSK